MLTTCYLTMLQHSWMVIVLCIDRMPVVILPCSATSLSVLSQLIITIFLAATAPLAPTDPPDTEAASAASASGPAPEVEGALKDIGVTDEALPGAVKVCERSW